MMNLDEVIVGKTDEVIVGKNEPSNSSDTRQDYSKSNRQWTFYIAALAALLVYSITSLSWLSVIYVFATKRTLFQDYSVANMWIGYSLLENPFSVYYQYLMWIASHRDLPPDLDSKSMSILLKKCFSIGRGRSDSSDINVEEAQLLRERLRVWFHYAELNDIYEDNLREWLSWAFASRTIAEVKEKDEINHWIEDALVMLQDRLNWKNVKPGYNPLVKSVRLTLDPFSVRSRPLAYYIVCNGLTGLITTWLRLFHGFHYQRHGRCTFLVKSRVTDATSSEKERLPILFMHGLGIGLGQYVFLLRRLVTHKSGVVILVQPHISASITDPNFLQPPSVKEQALATASMLHKVNMPRVTTLSHSNGTMVLAELIRSNPEMCANNILVDPVSFRLWEGKVCYSFVYRRWTSFIEVLLGYFIATEVGTARTISRNFQWSDMCLWVEDFPEISPERLHLFFGRHDLLIDVDSCVEYLQESGVPKECITVIPDYHHGSALMMDGQGMQLVAQKAGIGL
jgi:hypothetical protein